MTTDRRKQGGVVKNVFSFGIKYFKEQFFVKNPPPHISRGKTFENSLLISDVRNKLLSLRERILCFPAKDTVALFHMSDSYNYSTLLANWDISAEGFPAKTNDTAHSNHHSGRHPGWKTVNHILMRHSIPLMYISFDRTFPLSLFSPPALWWPCSGT